MFMENNTILKEEIDHFQIVAASIDKSELWIEELTYAVRLGNEFKGKTVITFQTSAGPKTVETTIWSATEHYLSLKGGINIPLKSIIDMHF